MLVGAQHPKLSSLPPRPFFPKNYPEDTFRKNEGCQGVYCGGAGAAFLFKTKNCKLETGNKKLETGNRNLEAEKKETENWKLKDKNWKSSL